MNNYDKHNGKSIREADNYVDMDALVCSLKSEDARNLRKALPSLPYCSVSIILITAK
jgi:hypothetical protein